jgi:hypothetical protein
LEKVRLFGLQVFEQHLSAEVHALPVFFQVVKDNGKTQWSHVAVSALQSVD